MGELKVISMRIHKYIPNKLYGFTIDNSDFQVFFHLGQFKPYRKDGNILPNQPPPILGEPVLVSFYQNDTTNKAPKAVNVERVQQPKKIMGTVESYDHSRGYGFIMGEDGVSYHLHNSEILNSRFPLQGEKVNFYAGIRLGKPRACHIEVIR